MRYEARQQDLGARVFQGLVGALMLFLLVLVVWAIYGDLWTWARSGAREDMSFTILVLALAPWLFSYAFRLLRGRGEEQRLRSSMPPRQMMVAGSVVIVATTWFAIWEADLAQREGLQTAAAGLLIGTLAVVTGVVRWRAERQ